MEYTFRKASHSDLDCIMDIIKEATQQMLSEGNDQWNDIYPTRKHFEATFIFSKDTAWHTKRL